MLQTLATISLGFGVIADLVPRDSRARFVGLFSVG